MSIERGVFFILGALVASVYSFYIIVTDYKVVDKNAKCSYVVTDKTISLSTNVNVPNILIDYKL